jgi:hypothetical protein
MKNKINKTCSECKISKPVSDFAKNKLRSFGVYSLCKSCKCKKQSEYRRTEKGREVGRENTRKYLVLCPEKASARVYTNRAIKRNEILPAKKLKCTYCSDMAKEYHHPDYSKPLGVEPVCKRCHKDIHNK